MSFGFGFGFTKITAAIRAAFSPSSLFAASEPGVWYDPSDFSTMFQDSAGTTPVTAVEQPVGLMLDKSGRGNHAYQTTATSRPVLSARVNQYLATETLATQNVTTLAAQYRLSFEGAGTITLSGTATGVYSAGSHLITCTAGTLTSTVSGSVTKADLRATNMGIGLPAYQRVNTATDYDTAGFPHYLRFDGVDDWLVTNTITPGIDKVQVFAGVRKLSDTLFSVISEYTADAATTNGSWTLITSAGASGAYLFGGRGSEQFERGSDVLAAPRTNVLTQLLDIGGLTADTEVSARINGASAPLTTFAGTTLGTGNYANAALYIGRRAGTSLPFNGHLYGLIVRFGANLPTATIDKTEKYINTKTGAY